MTTLTRASDAPVFKRRSPLWPAIAAWAVAWLGNISVVAKVAMFLPYLAILALLCAAVALSAVAFVRGKEVAKAIGALVIVSLVAFFIWLWPTLYDGTTFVAWAPTHLIELTESEGTDAVIRHWDAWGFAGMDNDSFLIADREDRLSTQAGAVRWQQRNGGSCQVLDAKRMIPGIFIAITDGCTPSVR
jgi:hypothetical protein